MAANKTVELVNAWAQYEQKYNEASIEEFCRHYLISQREKKSMGQNFKGVIPPQVDAYIAKLIGRIYQMQMVYCQAAFRDVPEMRQVEDFYFLNSIKNLGESRKTDIINYNFLELSSGVDVINRLLAGKFIEERTDPKDKRAKLVKATARGEKLLWKCYEVLIKVSDVVFWDMSEDDKKLCIQLLRNVEIKHAKLIPELKGKSIDEIHQQVTGVKVIKRV
jgi:DNA-binding MarR family transcriptional regulator